MTTPSRRLGGAADNPAARGRGGGFQPLTGQQIMLLDLIDLGLRQSALGAAAGLICGLDAEAFTLNDKETHDAAA